MEAQPSGVKRKQDMLEDGMATQRQSILDISRCKLQQRMSRHEPSLRRSVLIFNTLRHIERELRREGVMLNPAQAASLLPTLAPTSDATLDPPPSPMPDACPSGDASMGCTPCPASSATLISQGAVLPHHNPSKDSYELDHQVNHQMDNDGECAAARLQDNSRKYSSLSSTSISVTTQQQHYHSICTESWDTWLSDTKTLLSGDRSTSGTFSSLFDLDTGVTSPAPSPVVDVIGAAAASLPVSIGMCMSTTTTTTITSPSGSRQQPDSATRGQQGPSCLTDLDLSVLDLDLFSPHVSGKLPSLSAEELTSSLPPCGDPFGTFNAFCNPKHELLSDDLDHIMQVLVGI